MILGGLVLLSLTDFPGRVACAVFTQGCNLRCGYCHNPQLIGLRAPAGAETPNESAVLALLAARRGLLDGVVVSGGEPTLQPDLLRFLDRAKNLGLLIKLDTNGTRPLVLGEAVGRGLLDYVAMDVKHDPARYGAITGFSVDSGILAASRDLLLSSGIAHEFRTTVLPNFHDEATIQRIARWCGPQARLVLQPFRATRTADPAFQQSPAPTRERLIRFRQIAAQFVAEVVVRGEPAGSADDAQCHRPPSNGSPLLVG